MNSIGPIGPIEPIGSMPELTEEYKCQFGEYIYANIEKLFDKKIHSEEDFKALNCKITGMFLDSPELPRRSHEINCSTYEGLLCFLCCIRESMKILKDDKKEYGKYPSKSLTIAQIDFRLCILRILQKSYGSLVEKDEENAEQKLLKCFWHLAQTLNFLEYHSSPHLKKLRIIHESANSYFENQNLELSEKGSKYFEGMKILVEILKMIEIMRINPGFIDSYIQLIQYSINDILENKQNKRNKEKMRDYFINFLKRFVGTNLGKITTTARLVLRFMEDIYSHKTVNNKFSKKKTLDHKNQGIIHKLGEEYSGTFYKKGDEKELSFKIDENGFVTLLEPMKSYHYSYETNGVDVLVITWKRKFSDWGGGTGKTTLHFRIGDDHYLKNKPYIWEYHGEHFQTIQNNNESELSRNFAFDWYSFILKQ